jgi:hypothetical protein
MDLAIGLVGIATQTQHKQTRASTSSCFKGAAVQGWLLKRDVSRIGVENGAKIVMRQGKFNQVTAVFQLL